MAKIKDKLKDIKRFDFWFGNPFCGIKKLCIIFGENFEIKSNGLKEKNFLVRQSKVINELKTIDFDDWQEEYIKQNKPNEDHSWSIRLFFDDLTIEFRGLDAYPKDWFKVLDFTDKYAKFDVQEMMMEDENNEW